jgi:hypothetical protein
MLVLIISELLINNLEATSWINYLKKSLFFLITLLINDWESWYDRIELLKLKFESEFLAKIYSTQNI